MQCHYLHSSYEYKIWQPGTGVNVIKKTDKPTETLEWAISLLNQSSAYQKLRNSILVKR